MGLWVRVPPSAPGSCGRIRLKTLRFLSSREYWETKIWVSSESANAGACKALVFGHSWIDTNLAHQELTVSPNWIDVHNLDWLLA